MGKAQYKKKVATAERRHNPLAAKGRVPDAHLGHGQGAAANAAGQAKEQAMLPILKKISSPDATERAWSCAAVTNLIQNDPATRRLLQGKNVVGILIERLTDNEQEVVVEATGALRNLAIDGGHELCGEMYNKNVLTPLVALVPKISVTIQHIISTDTQTAGSSQDQAQLLSLSKKLVYTLAENVISLFWSLSETSNKILLAINAANIVPFLTAFIIYRTHIPVGVVLAAAQCLYSLSIDNRPFKRALTALPEAMVALQDTLNAEDAGIAALGEQKQKGKKRENGEGIVEQDSIGSQNVVDAIGSLKILVAGISRNVVEEDFLHELDSKHILPIARPILDMDLSAVGQEVQTLLPQLPDAATQAANAIKSMQDDRRSPAELRLEAIERRLTTLMVTLEVMTSACAGLTEDSLEEEDDWINGGAAPSGSREARQSKQQEEQEADDMEDGMEDGMEDDEGIEDLDEQLISRGRDPTAPVQLDTDGNHSGAAAKSGSTSAMLSSGIHLRLMALAQPTPLSYPGISDTDASVVLPSPHPPTTSLLSAIHLRALEALNNLLLTVSLAAPNPVAPLPAGVDDSSRDAWKAWSQSLGAGATSLSQIWDATFRCANEVVPVPQVIGVKGQEARSDVLDMLFGVMMSVAKIGAGCGLLSLSDSYLSSLISAFPLLRTSTSTSRHIVILSYLAMSPDAQVAQVKAIGDFYMKTLQDAATRTPVAADTAEVITTILNALFDVFADERSVYDVHVFRQGDYLGQLSGLVSKVRQVARGVDKRKSPELRTRAEEAYENLVAFIRYRRSVS